MVFSKFINDNVRASFPFSLNCLKHFHRYDRRMSMFSEVHVFCAFVLMPLLARKLLRIGFAKKHISGIFFICKYFYNGLVRPLFLAGRCLDFFGFKYSDYRQNTVSLHVKIKNELNDLCFFRTDNQFSILCFFYIRSTSFCKDLMFHLFFLCLKPSVYFHCGYSFPLVHSIQSA